MKKVIDGTPSESLPAACAKVDLKSSSSELPFKQVNYNMDFKIRYR